MRGQEMIRASMLALVAVVAGTDAVAAQSLTSARGPGYVLIPTDGRTSVMGGLGLGLKGFSASLTNPAAVAFGTRRGGIVSVEAVERNVRLGDDESDVGTTRFPLIRIVFPVRGAVLTVGYGGYLDQSWGLIREGEEVFEGTSVGFTDIMRSDGGVGQFQVGAAFPIGENLGVGAALGLLTGQQQVRFRRRFDTALEGVLDAYTEDLSWRYRAPMVQAGVRWEPMDELQVGGSVTWAGTLVGEGTVGRSARRELDLPLQVAAGASGFLVPGLLAAVSGRWSGWSVTDPDAIGLPGDGPAQAARDTWELGGGLEWDPARPAARRSYPVRVGIQYRQLPFPFADEAPTERFVGGGVGMRVGPDPGNPLAMIDLAVHRGTRTAAGNATIGDLTERMWRFTLSMSLFGN